MLSVVHNCNYLLALLLIHSLRTSICVCKYLYMLPTTFHDRGGGADDPDLSVALTMSTATFHSPDILYIICRNCYTPQAQGDPDSSFPSWLSCTCRALFLHCLHRSSRNFLLLSQSGLEKIPISQGLVTLLHIRGVIPTRQAPNRVPI